MNDETVKLSDVTLADAPDDYKMDDDPDTIYIAHKTDDGYVRMPMSEWPAYARKNGL